MYYDPCTSDTTSRYYINTSVGNSLTSTADAMRFQLGTTDKFVQLDTNKTSVISVSDFVGKDVIFAVTLNNTTNSTPAVWCISNGQWINSTISKERENDTLIAYANFNEDATRVQFMLSSTGNTGDTIDITDWTIYGIGE